MGWAANRASSAARACSNGDTPALETGAPGPTEKGHGQKEKPSYPQKSFDDLHFQPNHQVSPGNPRSAEAVGGYLK